jgi:UDP-N-acetylmuramoyl-tripeptide--D-alanyl-D-alanine ligase
MTNRATFTVNDLRVAFGDRAAHLSPTLVATGVSTDTRTLEPGSIFVALRGERFDGHDHIDAALEGGAAVIICERCDPRHHATAICVEDTLHALGTLGWYHRGRYDIPVIAIAGAAGKTSTKELTATVLSQAFRVLKTEANYNNRVGTPMTLLQLSDEHDVAVIEIGTNEPGEIETLCAMVRPTHGLITNIGKEHLEKLIDLDGVEREETALFDFLRDHGGTAFVNVDDPRLAKHVASLPKRVTFGIEHDADLRPTITFDAALRPTVALLRMDFTFNARMQAHGLAPARNAVCALALAWALGLSAVQVKAGLEAYTAPVGHGYARMHVERHGALTVLNDCYNANPDSMRLALDTLALFPAAYRVSILGDMRELGAAAPQEHDDILAHARTVSHLVIVLGPEFHAAVERVPGNDVIVCDTHEACARACGDSAPADAVVLVKGSRGLTMEHVIESLNAPSQGS